MFDERLTAKVTLTLGADAHTLPAGAVERWAFHATPYALAGEVTFYVSSEDATDDVFEGFLARDVATVKLALASADVSDDEEPATLTVLGTVVEKRVREVASYDLLGNPIVGRHYTVRFVDAAQAFWKQHKPLELLTNASMHDVLEAHKPEGATLTYDWDELDRKRIILCIALREDEPATFYDFVMGFVHDNHGVVELDAETGAYRIAKGKARGAAPVKLDLADAAELDLIPDMPPRHVTRVLSSFVDGVQKKTATNKFASDGVRRDRLLESPIPAHVDRRVKLESRRLTAGETRFELLFKRFPRQPFAVGLVVEPSGEFSGKLYASKKAMRVIEIEAHGHAPEGLRLEAVDETIASFQMEMRGVLERREDAVPHLPDFVRPTEPVLVEGRVESASGGDPDRTWFSAPGEHDSLEEVTVRVPLFNKKIPVPFTPGFMPGHFFFPAYKNQRVRVAIDFDSARIVAFLDWAQNGKLSRDTQGDVIALGYKDGNGTVIRHTYKDEKPQLHVERKLGKDIQTIEVSEGYMLLEVKENPAAAKVEPKFDVTLQVTAAKGRVGAQVQGSIGAVTGKFQGAVGEVTGAIEGAAAEVSAKVGAAAATLVAKTEEVEVQLEELGGSLGGSVAAVAAGVGAAKAELRAALTGSGG